MAKVLITYDKPTSRMLYGAEVLFKTCLGAEVEWVSGGEAHSYSISHEGKTISCPIHAISFSNDELAVSSGVSWTEFEGEKYPCEVLGGTDLLFDPLAATVFFVARWEEVFLKSNSSLDKHGRFSALGSSSYREGVLEKPSVDILAQQLAKTLGLDISHLKYSFSPSIDVDVAYKYLHRPSWKNIGGLVKDALTLKNPLERLSVLRTKSNDSYDTYAFIESLHSKSGLSTTYYVLRTEHKKPYDVCVNREGIDSLISQLQASKNTTVHWHPSYKATSDMSSEYTKEKGEFTGDSTFVRHHFLRSDPSMWTTMEKAGVKRDSSMAYADLPGFRAGICREYQAYDLKSEKPLDLTILPPVVMDSTLKSYMQLSPEKAVEKVEEISKTVREVRGTMVTIWHNTSVSDDGFWKGWQKVYEEVVRVSIP